MNDYYTRKEVGEILGISNATIYNYAKQKKIIKIQDPHRLVREARYKRAEIDALALVLQENKVMGIRPPELAKQLDVQIKRIYTIIKELNLDVDQIPLGDEKIHYSISDEIAAIIIKEVERTKSKRGNRIEFFDSKYDVSLYQLYHTPDGQEVRAVRNSDQEWGFHSPYQTWIPFEMGLSEHRYRAAYSIHQNNAPVKGYTEFLLPKNKHESYKLLDFVYQVCGIENIRLRELEIDIALSIKSGEIELTVPTTISASIIDSFITSGKVIISDDKWQLISGYRRTSMELPTNILDKLELVSKRKSISRDEYLEEALREKMEREGELQ